MLIFSASPSTLWKRSMSTSAWTDRASRATSLPHRSLWIFRNWAISVGTAYGDLAAPQTEQIR
jgi:hypothetical protein